MEAKLLTTILSHNLLMMYKLFAAKIIYLLLNDVHELQGYCNSTCISKSNKMSDFCDISGRDSSYEILIIRNKMIKSDRFKGSKYLACIHLQNNSLSEIKPETFRNLYKMEKLRIEHNNLGYIGNGTFRFMGTLKRLYLSNNCIKNIYSESFLGLKSLTQLWLTQNKLYHLKPRSFQPLSSLICLDLSENCIQKLYACSFFGLHSLTNLYMSKNCLETVSAKMFLGLKSLNYLDLKYNKVNHLKGEAFMYLTALNLLALSGNQLKLIEGSFLQLKSPSILRPKQFISGNIVRLERIEMSKNYLKIIHFTLFSQIPSLKSIRLTSNLISTCVLTSLVNLTEIFLDDNKLIFISKIMFKGIYNLHELHLEKNYIQTIEKGAFKDLKKLETLCFQHNNLTLLTKEFITDLSGLMILKLQNNPIQIIEEGAFHRALPAEQLDILLSNDKIPALDISWKIYLKSSLNERNLTMAKDNFHKTNLIFCESNIECVKTLCWIKHLKYENFFDNVDEYYDYNYDKNILKYKCNNKFQTICPKAEEWCMNDNSTRCISQCLSLGYPGGNLVIHKYFCPFQYFCSCTCVTDTCHEKCEKEGKVSQVDIDIFGCDICNCQCRKLNCWMICKGDNFQEINNTYGCLECNCRCPDRDCNAPCQGEGNGLVTYDAKGCMVCNGCRYEETNENKRMFIILVPTLLLSILSLCTVLIIILCMYKRYRKQNRSFEKKVIDPGLDIITQNLDPNLAQKVKENFFEPEKLRLNHMLGNGQFGIVWSGVFEKSLGRKFPVAVKIAKAEYKDVWAVETKWNSKHQLKPHFEKKRVQMQLHNQVIEDLLMEALIMKKFSHSNILNMIGISMYEDKPCIMLPLMHNGDLKKYLWTNKSNLAIPVLTAFALGVTKGMVYLAEQKFVHCDLAARNCMLDANLVVKISDFGLTRDVKNTEYCKEENTNIVLPIRWMSIEAIQFRKFTLQSDMWSLGVVMWEIFSCGEFPYKGIENKNVLKYLLNGNRLEKPENCPDHMYSIILQCWNNDPDERPSAYAVLDIVNRIADEEGHYTAVEDEPEATASQINDNVMEYPA